MIVVEDMIVALVIAIEAVANKREKNIRYFTWFEPIASALAL